ncbi:MAG: hypothetical protein RLZZ118_1306 [Bacteroidota bacterium]
MPFGKLDKLKVQKFQLTFSLNLFKIKISKKLKDANYNKLGNPITSKLPPPLLPASIYKQHLTEYYQYQSSKQARNNFQQHF